MKPINWDDAPLDTALWGVYGPDCFPTVFACKLHHASGYGRAIWGFSVYRRKPGFRTLGEGREWADRHKLRLFASREAAFAHIASLFGKAK